MALRRGVDGHICNRAVRPHVVFRDTSRSLTMLLQPQAGRALRIDRWIQSGLYRRLVVVRVRARTVGNACCCNENCGNCCGGNTIGFVGTSSFKTLGRNRSPRYFQFVRDIFQSLARCEIDTPFRCPTRVAGRQCVLSTALVARKWDTFLFFIRPCLHTVRFVAVAYPHDTRHSHKHGVAQARSRASTESHKHGVCTRGNVRVGRDPGQSNGGL